MDANKLDMYLMTNAKFFPADKIEFIRNRMAVMDDSRYMMLSSIELKDPTTMLILSIFTGEFGVDRFMLGDTGIGILKLLTGGVCGVLWLIDICGITQKTKDFNFNRLMQVL